MTRTKRNPNPPDQDPEVQQLKIDWPTLKDPYIKGDRLLPLRARFSLAQLAAEFGISTKRVRDLLELASVRGTEREDAKKLGVKTVLATLRKNRKTIRRWGKQTTGQSGRKLKNRLASLLRHWLEQNLPAEQIWDPFLSQSSGATSRSASSSFFTAASSISFSTSNSCAAFILRLRLTKSATSRMCE